MCRAWPTLSANTVAQNPGDSVIPPLSPAQALPVLEAALRASCAADGWTLISSTPAIGNVIAASRTGAVLVAASGLMISVSVSPDHDAESHGRGPDPSRWIGGSRIVRCRSAARSGDASGSRLQPTSLRAATGGDLGWIAVI